MQDWQEMAARGISVVRLVVNWSKLEPQRGAISEAYLDEIDEAVSNAAAYGIYTVIDMHQDGFSAFILPRTPTNVRLAPNPARAGTARLNGQRSLMACLPTSPPNAIPHRRLCVLGIISTITLTA